MQAFSFSQDKAKLENTWDESDHSKWLDTEATLTE